jgi:fumarylacetoacetase
LTIASAPLYPPSAIPPLPDDEFGLDNIAFGVVAPRATAGPPRVVVRIGDHALDLGALGEDALEIDPRVLRTSSLNALFELGRDTWRAVRTRVQHVVRADGCPEHAWLPLEEVDVLLPIDVGDYVDFYASLDHATNLGRILRPGIEPLLANWRHLPVGYTGRAGTVVVSGTPITRPEGLRATEGAAAAPRFGPSTMLDIELEVAFVVGATGKRIAPDDADRYVFGAVLLNDWSARDIQAYEYQPLGPHLGKSFATTISPWVVPLDALAPYLVAPPRQDPEPAAYLRAKRPWGLDLQLRVALNGTQICVNNFRVMYWTFAQQLAHLTVNGATTRPGDLFASGTVSGPNAGQRGSLIEITWRGEHPLALADGSTRTFLADGDTVELRGWCGGEGRPRVGFGRCVGTIVSSPSGGA